MSFKSLTAAVALIVATSTPFMAISETREERVEAAKGYVEMSLQDLDMKALIQTMWKPVVQMIESQGKEVSAEKQEQIDALYQEAFTVPMYETMRGQTEIMADLFTLDEIQALADFYATEHGRATMTKLPQLLEAQQPEIMKMVQTEMGSLMPKIIAIIDAE